MIFVRIMALVVFSPFFLVGKLLGLCRRDIAYLPEDHPEMAGAFAKARASLPEFRRLLAEPKPTMRDFAVKVRFPVSGGSEHCWVDTLEPRGAGFVGKLANQPEGVHGVRLGSIVDVSEEMISDWAYSDNGVYHGHFTTKVLLPRMSKKMRRQVEQVYGWSSAEKA